MSVQMRLVHTRMGMTPPALHSGESAREMALHAPQPSPMPARMRARFTATTDGGVTRVLPKRGLRSGGVLVFLHGGAYAYPLVEGQWGIVEGLIDRTGLPVIIPDYPLAPKHAATDAFDVVQPIIDEAQAEFGRVILFGDSAGGGLAISLAMQRRDAGARQVDGLVLYAPWVDVTMMNPAITDVQRLDKILRVPGLAWAGRAWAGDLDPADPRVSPCTTIFPHCRQCSSSRATPTSWVPTRLSLRARQLAPAWTCACAWSRGLPRLRPVRPLHSRGRGCPGPQRSLRDGDSQEPLRPRVSGTFHGLVGGRDEAVDETRGRCGEAQFR